MRFIITEKSFYMEEGGVLSGELQAWQEAFMKDKEYAWYLLGLKGCPPDADISMRFFCKVAESYFRCLTSLPELELSKEKTEVLLDVDGKWFGSAFDRLHDVFRREIAAYSDMVAR